MKQIVLLLLIFMYLFTAKAQNLTLEQCQELARENYPLVNQKRLIEKSSEFNISNARRNWFPQVTFSAQVTYQSEVMDLPEEVKPLIEMFPDFSYEGLHKDQYKAVLQIEQIIYGGGAVKAQIETAKAESEASKQNWEVEMYSLRERVNQLYFGTLLLQEKIKEIDLMIEELDRNQKLVQSYVANGIAGKNDLDKLKVEQLTAIQQKSELVATKKAYRNMLGIMINKEINENTRLIKPEISVVSHEIKYNRPELRYLDAQEKMLDVQRKGVNAMVTPQIGAFFQGAYANPGLNLFEDMQKNQWSPYFVTGIRFQWNIAGFYTRGNQLAKIDINRSQINSQRETFLYNMDLKSSQEQIAIDRMYEVMQDDDEIINLRNSIRKRTEAEMENGTSTVSDLLREIHAENLARQNKVTHEIELLKNIYDLKYTTNN